MIGNPSAINPAAKSWAKPLSWLLLIVVAIIILIMIWFISALENYGLDIFDTSTYGDAVVGAVEDAFDLEDTGEGKWSAFGDVVLRSTLGWFGALQGWRTGGKTGGHGLAENWKRIKNSAWTMVKPR